MPAILFTTGFSTNSDFYMNEDPTDHTEANVIDDNFDSDFKSQLTQPTNEATVAQAVDGGNNADVVLWRGTNGSRVANMEAQGSAGGLPPDANIAAPSPASAQTQIAFGNALPEFTTRTDLGFSFRHWLAVVTVNTRYLTKGSGSEGGWVCNAAAPLTVVEKVDRTLGFPEPPYINGA